MTLRASAARARAWENKVEASGRARCPASPNLVPTRAQSRYRSTLHTLGFDLSSHQTTPPAMVSHFSRGKAECMHASIACLLLYEDYVWVSLGNAMKAKQSKVSHCQRVSIAPRRSNLSNGPGAQAAQPGPGRRGGADMHDRNLKLNAAALDTMRHWRRELLIAASLARWLPWWWGQP